MNKIVKHSINQTKDYACSGEWAKDVAKYAARASVMYIAVAFIKNVINNYINEED